MDKLLCGVDLGGTKLSAGLFSRNGGQIDRLEIKDHVDRDNDGVTETIVGLVEEILSKNRLQDSDLLGIGIGVAAHIRFKEGLIITSSNFRVPFKNYPMREKVQSYFRVPVILDNDANAQAYGEFTFGAGRGRKDVVFMTVSSGIGAGIIIDGRLLRGVTGTAGEIGHTITQFESDQLCTCGNRGCLMAQASGIFFPSLFQKKLEEGKTSLMNIIDVSTVDGQTIARGFKQGDEICTEIFYESARMIGIGVYNIFQMLNPEAVIIGGGLMNLGQEYIEQIGKTFYAYVKEMMYDRMEIVLAELKGESGLVGAAALLLEQA
jgi:glucokinase